MDAFPDAAILAFTPHGMGPNLADVSAMLLLPELFYRHYTGKLGFRADESWSLDGTGGPNPALIEDWSVAVLSRMQVEQKPRRWFWGRVEETPGSVLDWMPAARYRTAWPGMPAYAMPAFYEGLVRINLKGREKRGRVELRGYQAAIDEVAELIKSCRDPISGEPIDIDLDYRGGDPQKRSRSDADLAVHFRKPYYAFRHERLGLIGPAPCRRPGGHTGGLGAGYFCANRAGSGADLGCFRTSELSGAISALMGLDAAGGELGKALLQVAG